MEINFDWFDFIFVKNECSGLNICFSRFNFVLFGVGVFNTFSVAVYVWKSLHWKKREEKYDIRRDSATRC
jgi:hypothetical protein